MEPADIRDATSLFRDLPDPELEFLASVASELNFPAESYLFTQDGEADQLFVVLRGLVGLELPASGREPIVILSIGPSELLGISWMVPPYRWALSARAFQDTTVLALDAAAIRDRAEEDKELKLVVLELVTREAAKRLHATRVQLLDLYEHRS